MTDSRTTIFNKFNESTSALRPHPGAPIKPTLPNSDLAEQLKHRLQAAHASVDIIDSNAELDQSIFEFLQAHQCPLEVGVHSLTDIDQLALNDRVQVYRYQEISECQTLLSFSPLGIAETGSIVMPSSLERPTLANFLPDNCIFVLKINDIVAHLEDALLHIQQSDAGMPRALNIISGPSKTADIEQTLVYGAHGPIQLHLIIVRDE